MTEPTHIVVEESDRPLDLEKAIDYAVEKGAVKPADDPEGEETFYFLFPGQNIPKYYDRDELAAEIRTFNNPDSGE